MQLLVVDDDDLVRDYLRTALSRANHEVETACNGREALEMLARRPVGVVITDILMPEKEGIETILEIRARFPGTRIIAISGGGRTANFTPLQIAAKMGADLILQKPLRVDDLLQAVRTVAGETAKRPAAEGAGRP